MRLNRAFFIRPGRDGVYGERAVKIGKSLLGKFIVRRIGQGEIAGEIVEVEIYAGPKDKAAHSFGGRVTPRNQVMYKPGGVAYVYFVYGMHWQMNVVIGREGEPQGILIRAIKLENGSLINGPGKVAKRLRIDGSYSGENLVLSKKLWLEDRGVRISPKKIKSSGRIGIEYAGIYWRNRKWRFYISE